MLAVGIDAPQDLQIVLTSENCLNKPYIYEQLKCKTSIIATIKEIWRPNRRALNTTFNPKILQSYMPLLNEKAKILVDQFHSHIDEAGDLYRTIFIGMIDMIIRTTMGSEMHLQTTEHGPWLFDVAKEMMSNIQYRIARLWLRWDFTYSLSKVYRDEQQSERNGNKFLEEIYQARIHDFDNSKDEGIDDLMDMEKGRIAKNLVEKCIMMERDGTFTHENALDQCRLILLAGVDTSSITIFSTLLLLAIHQKHQDLVLAELNSIFDSADCEVTQEHLKNMTYTERCIREALRLFPPAPFIGRKSSDEIELASGTIPKNTVIVINIFRLHRNPEIWGKNANEFDPDRFLPENIAKRPPYSYIPFSGGARNCIGMRYAMMTAKITLAYLLRRYKLTSDLKIADIRLKIHLVLEIINKNPIKVESRNF